MSFFKSFRDVFRSNDSYFRETHDKYTEKKLNALSHLDLTDFPDGFKSIAKKIDDESPLSRLLLMPEINAEKLIELCLISTQAVKQNKKEYIINNVERIHQLIVEKNSEFSISNKDFEIIIADCAQILINLIYEMKLGIDTVYVENVDYAETAPESYENIFKRYGIFVGFGCLVAIPIAAQCVGQINQFLSIQNIKTFKSFDDLQKANLLKNIYDKTKSLNLLPVEKLNKLHNIVLNQTAENDDFSFSNYIDWLTFVLVCEGLSLETAEVKINELKFKLSSLSEDWNWLCKFGLTVTGINDLELVTKLNVISKSTEEIYSYFYQKA